MWIDLRSEIEGGREPERRFTTDDTLEGGLDSTTPRMGAECGMGEPGVTPMSVRDGEPGVEGELYRYVERRTIVAPMRNARVIG